MVIALPKVEVPLTDRLEVPVVLITVLPEAIERLPTVSAARKSRIALEVMVNAAEDEPKADALVTTKVPPLMVVPPVYALVPDKVWVPACSTTLAPVPVMDPLKLSSFAAVNVSDLDPALTVPAPAKLLILAPEVVPLISKVPVAVTTEEPAIEPPVLRHNVPALIVVAPVYVLAPVKTTVPEPVFVIPKLPEIIPESVRVSPTLVALKVLLAVSVILPAKLLVTSLIVPPASVTASAPTVTLSKSNVPLELIVVAPAVDPNPAPLEIFRVPALMVVIPV